MTAERVTTRPLDPTMLPELSSEPTWLPEALYTRPSEETEYVVPPTTSRVRSEPVPMSVSGLTALAARTLPFVPTILPDASTDPIRVPDAFVTVRDESILYVVPLIVTETRPRPGTMEPPPATTSS